MENPQGNANRGRGFPRKPSVTQRRIWTKREEEVLIAALRDLVNHGWKSDNGFRTGYLTRLEDALKAAFPGTDLQISPNITSKLTTWKKSYGSMVTAQRDTTGAGFNMTTNTLEVTDDQWNQIVQRDPSMRGMRMKEWPFFPDWLEIFGKDRATGEVAEDVNEMADVMRQQYTQPSTEGGLGTGSENNYENFINLDDDSTPRADQNCDEGHGENSAAPTKAVPQPSTNTSKKRKRKTDSSEPSMAAMLGEFTRTTAERLDVIARRMGFDHDTSTARRQVVGLLANVTCLSMDDKLDISEIIGARDECLDTFMGLDEGARARYAIRLLDKARARG